MTGDEQKTRLAHVALKAYFRIAERWGITDAQAQTLLGSPSYEQWERWRTLDPAVLDVVALLRISYAVGIHHALMRLLGSEEQIALWLRSTNNAPLFRGGTPLDYLCSGSLVALRDTRAYLDAQFEWG